jgi:hypothetical protein
LTCPFTLNGEGEIENDDTMHLAYEGTTCLGPVNGEVTLRRPRPDEPPPPPPAPPELPPAPEPEQQPSNRNHVGPGPLDRDRAKLVVERTAAEYPHLLGPFPTDRQAIRAAEELLLRSIWHLQRAGFQAGRQRNPSGAISNDKLTVFAEGEWRAYDIFRDYGVANQVTDVIFLRVHPADPIAYPGIPD